MKKYWLFFLILIISILLRLLNLDKAGGLWYDEATIYSIASQNGIFKMLDADSHRFLLFPLYYIIYHFWINIFGNSDFIIRLMPVFFDTLATICAYFAGKQLGTNLNSKNVHQTGLMYMLLYGINSSFIYYAQEAKFYSLTFFIINLIILFWLKFIKDRSDKALWILTFLNFILILAYTSQILLVIILFLITLIYLKRNISLKQIGIYSLSFLPLLIASLFSKNYFSGNFDAVVYDNSFILLALQNWFTPLLQGLQNNVLNYHIYLFKNVLNFNLWLFVIFPAAFIIYSFAAALKKYPLTRYLFAVGFVYVLCHIILTNFTNYNVLVRYTLAGLPFMLICASCTMKNKWLISLFVIVNLLGIISISGAPYIARPDGYRMLGQTLIQQNISQDYDFILPIRTNLLDKYFDIKGRRHSLYILNSPEAQKTYLTVEELNNENKYESIKRYLTEDKIPHEFENYITEKFVHGKNIVVLTDRSISMYSNEQLKYIANSQEYEKYPFQFLRLSKLNNDLITILNKKMKLNKNFHNKNWEIFVFEI